MLAIRGSGARETLQYTRAARGGGSVTALEAQVRAQRAAAGEQTAQAEEQQARLAERQMPKNAAGFVARIAAKRTLGCGVHQIHQAAVIGLLERMKGAANKEVQIEFAAQG